jgi:hypothetical protein
MTNCGTVGSGGTANGRWKKGALQKRRRGENRRHGSLPALHLEALASLRLSSSVLTKPTVLLRIEGGIELVLSLIFYQYLHANWILFVLLLLAPDLAMLGYLGGIRLGTIFYNLIHTLAGPFLLIAYAYLTGSLWLVPYALIWTSHIGLDRMLGFGLKDPTQFSDTHLKE